MRCLTNYLFIIFFLLSKKEILCVPLQNLAKTKKKTLRWTLKNFVVSIFTHATLSIYHRGSWFLLHSQAFIQYKRKPTAKTSLRVVCLKSVNSAFNNKNKNKYKCEGNRSESLNNDKFWFLFKFKKRISFHFIFKKNTELLSQN